jgi:hypothetical protein
MPVRITIKTVGHVLLAELNDSPTAQAIAAAIPIQGHVNRWGEEIYFWVPVQQPLAPDAKEEMDIGELGYWPPGSAFCIFFGPTPASRSNQPRAASPVNPIGQVLDDATVLKDVPQGARILLERA